MAYVCGAKTKRQRRCQRPVSEPGQHCHDHSGKTTPRAILNKVYGVCGVIATITGAAQGVAWVHQTAWPYIDPLWQSGLFCPERFWWDNLAYPVQRGDSTADIPSNLKAVLAQLRKDEERSKELLARHSERDRQRIVDAYDKVLAEIRRSYPTLAKSPPGAA